ncbi:GumC family protein [Pontibacter sp. MBLB2868]|uniref:GumC family protein n=1 Tax=Pontibacter sp. MBLB2868 TaxID=3451555 RepID=UPI003F75580E
MSELDFQDSESESIDIKGVLAKYLRYWYLFVLGVVLSLAIAYLYLRYATPLYSVSSTLLVKDDQQGANVLFSDLALLQNSKSMENEIIVLKSSTLMQRVLTELSLNTRYFVDGRVKSIELYGENRPIKVIASNLDSAALRKTFTIHVKDKNIFELEDEAGSATYQFGKQINKPYGSFTVLTVPGKVVAGKTITVLFQDIRKRAEYYNQALAIAPYNKSASVLVLSLVDAVPEKAEDIINKLTEVYIAGGVEDKKRLATSTIQFIDERLKYLTEELTAVEKDVEQYKKENELVDVSTAANLALSNTEAYRKQLADLAIQIDILESIESYITKEEKPVDLIPTSLSISDPTLGGLIANFNQLQLERQRLLQTAKPESPLVKNINVQLANLQENILENLRNVRRGLTISRNNLQASASQFRSKVQQAPTLEREMQVIGRQQGIKSELYLYLLQKREEAAISLAATVSNSRVIDPATKGDMPVDPKPQMVYLIALLVGLAVPFAGITVADLLNDKVQLVKDVEKKTATPILGELNHSDTFETVIVKKDSRTPVAEQFRLIRSNLQFATIGKENKVILITSSMTGEGKTFFSINLAASLMLTGKKVVIIGFDLRKPKLTQGLNLPNDMGITNYLISDQVGIEDIVQKVPEHPNLYVIGVGPIPPNPGELMMLPKIGVLIEQLKEVFDHVVIDTAPVGQVADAFALAPYIDSSIYLVRYNYTSKSQLAIIDDIYRSKKLKHPMIVLNDAKKGNSHGYGYGYGYGYGDDEKQGWRKSLKKRVNA